MALEISMYRGDDATFPFTLTQGGTPQDLTGATLVFSCRLASTFEDADEDAAAALIVSGGDIVLANQGTDPGEITVTVPAADSVDLTTGKYLCDVQVTESGGDIWTWPEPVYGESTLIRLRVKPDVTHV